MYFKSSVHYGVMAVEAPVFMISFLRTIGDADCVIQIFSSLLCDCCRECYTIVE